MLRGTCATRARVLAQLSDAAHTFAQERPVARRRPNCSREAGTLPPEESLRIGGLRARMRTTRPAARALRRGARAGIGAVGGRQLARAARATVPLMFAELTPTVTQFSSWVAGLNVRSASALWPSANAGSLLSIVNEAGAVHPAALGTAQHRAALRRRVDRILVPVCGETRSSADNLS